MKVIVAGPLIVHNYVNYAFDVFSRNQQLFPFTRICYAAGHIYKIQSSFSRCIHKAIYIKLTPMFLSKGRQSRCIFRPDVYQIYLRNQFRLIIASRQKSVTLSSRTKQKLWFSIFTTTFPIAIIYCLCKPINMVITVY